MMEKAMEMTAQADILLIIGTSMQVYPAAGLVSYAPYDTPIYFIDPEPNIAPKGNLNIIKERATVGVPRVVESLIS